MLTQYSLYLGALGILQRHLRSHFWKEVQGDRAQKASYPCAYMHAHTHTHTETPSRAPLSLNLGEDQHGEGTVKKEKAVPTCLLI